MLLFFVACHPSSSTNVPDQLENLEVLAQGAPDEFEPGDFAGTMAVEGGVPDFEITVDTLGLTLHTPGQNDLASLAGRAVSLRLLTGRFEDARSVVISDETGLAYVADVGHSVDEVNAALGAEVVSYGEALATSENETYDYTWRAVDFAGDEGVVTLLPGQADTVVIGGVSWRAVVVSAYQRVAKPRATLPACDTLNDMLSYELMRVDTPAEPIEIVRPEGLDAARLGCG